MASSNPLAISPRKLRSDLHSSAADADADDIPLVISVLASLLERTMARNQRILERNYSVASSESGRIQIFDSSQVPDLTIQSYLERIHRYTRAGPSVYVVAYVYIDRFCQANPGFNITSRNVHRLLITTIVLASKYVEDMNYKNSYLARVGGVTTEELNRMEVDFLFMMGFKMHVNLSVFESYCCHLEREVSVGGGYQIEKTLRCAQEIKSGQIPRRRLDRFSFQISPRIML
ncbi:CYCU2-1 [Linum grandiflorum]